MFEITLFQSVDYQRRPNLHDMCIPIHVGTYSWDVERDEAGDKRH